ncbi:PepSY domain-containing protein [Catenovulum sp. 2E275]|uniref:PepSY domain-containing protein n=1 Tax=Catenovulum sp. 2E275 TaxID=2980497 RepID=UPI0021D11247|nr:PepSY domain-containing protein [Catenovulum sp. 2E275]MCU4674924.1 PepSY domain-containing protein [Catenovulum sp. 2E275]
MLSFFRTLLIIFSLMSLTLSGQIQAQPQAQTMTMRHAVNTVQKTYQGKLLKAYETRINQQTYYRVKLLTPSGRVISVLVNAHSGQMKKE